MRAAFEVADVLRQHWRQVEHHPQINGWQLRTLSALKRCRTADLGGHVDACTDFGTVRVSYNSCRNRHCPKCQGKNREQWLEAREAELLPVPYFHVVFTLPDTLNRLALHRPKAVYDSLFEAAWKTVAQLAGDPGHLGAKPGMIAILHIPIRFAIGTGSGGSSCPCIRIFTASCREAGSPRRVNGKLPEVRANSSFRSKR